VLSTEDSNRDLMARIFGVQVPGKAYDITKPLSALL
jgi:hypothetical protein